MQTGLSVAARRHPSSTNRDVRGVRGRESGIRAMPGRWIERYLLRRKMARDLEDFTDAMLEDFGLTREEARKEVAKPFWRA